MHFSADKDFQTRDVMPYIPKQIFTIWYGSMLPNKYQENIKKLKNLNPDYRVQLISDPKTMTVKSYKLLNEFCIKNVIKLNNIRNCEDEYGKIIIQELDKSLKRNSDKIKRIHYVRSSDLTRFRELYKMGGIYIDVDMKPTKGFGTLKSNTGLLITSYSDDDVDLNTWGVYDLIATSPKMEMFKDAMHLHEKDEDFFKSYKCNPLFHPKASRQALRAYVVLTTGSLLYFSYAAMKGKLNKERLQKDILNARNYVARRNDNSWLPSTPNIAYEKEEWSYILFLVDKLVNKRLQSLPGVLKQEASLLSQFLLLLVKNNVKKNKCRNMFKLSNNNFIYAETKKPTLDEISVNLMKSQINKYPIVPFQLPKFNLVIPKIIFVPPKTINLKISLNKSHIIIEKLKLNPDNTTHLKFWQTQVTKGGAKYKGYKIPHTIKQVMQDINKQTIYTKKELINVIKNSLSKPSSSWVNFFGNKPKYFRSRAVQGLIDNRDNLQQYSLSLPIIQNRPNKY